eukprot:1680650-Karenia_brevis.AAC.1
MAAAFKNDSCCTNTAHQETQSQGPIGCDQAHRQGIPGGQMTPSGTAGQQATLLHMLSLIHI